MSEFATAQVDAWRNKQPGAQPDAYWATVVTPEHGLLLLLALNPRVWEERQAEGAEPMAKGLAIELLLLLANHTEVRRQPIWIIATQHFVYPLLHCLGPLRIQLGRFAADGVA